MRITIGNQIVTIIAGLAAAASMQALATWPGSCGDSVGPAAGPHAARPADGVRAQDAAVGYWTPARMAAAVDPELGTRSAWLTGNTAGQGLPWTHGGAVAAAVGKVFFTLDDVDYVCTGALIGGRHPDVVLTAAHCVSGGTGLRGAVAWAANWLFVPAFRDGAQPYGEYTARRFYVSAKWTGADAGRESYDVAFVPVTAATLVGDGRVATPPPGLSVQFARDQDAAGMTRTYVFGYPAEPPYDGMESDFCAGPVGAAPGANGSASNGSASNGSASSGSVETACGMTAGDSGGPWFARFSPRSGTGTVTAVTTYKLTGDLRVLYGAVLGPVARALYERASA
jgi:hypothetical protein